MPATPNNSTQTSAAPIATDEPMPSSPPKPVDTGSAQADRIPVSVVILTLNEEINIAECIRSCDWCDDVHVLDSGSTDETVAIAQKMGVATHYNAFKSFGDQRNWAIDNIPTKHQWIFHLDADEQFTPELIDAMRQLIQSNPHQAGFHIPHKIMFMGRWLKRSAGYPTYQMRLFHKERMRFIDYGHGQRENDEANIGVLDEPYLHYSFSKGIYDWLEKHNRYSSLEALRVLKGSNFKWKTTDLLFANKVRRRRALKELVYRLPLRSKLRWFGILFVNAGILEGKAGLTYANLMAMYENMITTKIRLLRSQQQRNVALEQAPPADPTKRFDAQEQPIQTAGQTSPASVTNATTTQRKSSFLSRDTAEDRHAPMLENAPPTSRECAKLMREFNIDHLPQLQPEASPWSLRDKIARATWMLIGRPLFRISFHNWYRYRRMLLRLFGAKVGANVVIRPNVHIEIPWMLNIEDDASIGDKAIIYSLGKITIGKRAIISQYAHLCAGTHDYTDHTFKLIRTPISIGEDCWVGADAFIGPGVTVGTLSVIGARSSVYKNIPPGKVAVGNPAKPIKDRELQ